MRKWMIGAIAACVAVAPSWAIKIDSPSEAVNIAGKQRMYTQRMLKDYAMIGMHNSFGDPAKDLKETIAAFDDHLELLQAYAQNDEIKKSLENVVQLWQPLKKMLSETPDLSKAADLQRKIDALLKASNEATQKFADATGKQSGEIVNISGRQRMLSQRMAALYMLKAWGLRDPEFAQKLADAVKLFKTSLKTLEKAPQNDDTIRKKLESVKRAFVFFEMMGRSKSKFIVPNTLVQNYALSVQGFSFYKCVRIFG